MTTAVVETLSMDAGGDDQRLGEMIGLTPGNMEDLTETRVYHLGNVTVQGTNVETPVMRFHCGPEGSIKRGGTKFKAYPSEAEQRSDGIDHGRSMFYKIGGIGETAYAGGKTIASINPRRMSRDQMIDAMGQVANLMHEAGLADPAVDGTAGDEGTNGYIDYYVEALRARGVHYPEACITGKSDMRPRAAATGRGAAIVHRAIMEQRGEDRTSAAVQGTGFAGAYYAAEAFEPYNELDRERPIVVSALGDLNPTTERPAVLYTDHPEGLPVSKAMVDAMLRNPDDPDMNNPYVRGFKLAALARKIESAYPGRRLYLREADVLSYDAADYLVPAATSNVFTPNNLGNVSIKNILEIGNHTIRDDAKQLMQNQGFRVIAGELANAGGVQMSIQENRRDLARIAAEGSGETFITPDDDAFEQQMRTRMIEAAHRVYAVSQEYGLDTATAVQVVSLGNYALSRGMSLDARAKQLLVI